VRLKGTGLAVAVTVTVHISDAGTEIAIMNQRSSHHEYFTYVFASSKCIRILTSNGGSDDLPLLPLSDQNSWYYPSHGYSPAEEDLHVSSEVGNWGNKTVRDARWVRRGKITPWGPGVDDWEVSHGPHCFSLWFTECFDRRRNVLENV
jgi:hypothetical protein